MMKKVYGKKSTQHCSPKKIKNSLEPSIIAPRDNYVINIEQETLDNTNYRKIVSTGQHLQTSLMFIPCGTSIGEEVHNFTDQFFRIEKGRGLLIISDKGSTQKKIYVIQDGDAFTVYAGQTHNIYAVDGDLKLYTIYAPPHHLEGLVHKTKEEAESDTTDHL